jgi:uncharacterized protein YukE
MTELKDFYEALEPKANEAVVTVQTLKDEIASITANYIGNMFVEKASEVTKQANDHLASLHEKAQAEVDKLAQKYQTQLEKHYFNDVTVDVAAELDMIAGMKLAGNELEAYGRKFIENGSAMRRLEQVAADNRFMLKGPLYSRDLDDMNTTIKQSQSLLNAILNGDIITVTIAKNVLKGHVERREAIALANKTVTVFPLQ